MVHQGADNSYRDDVRYCELLAGLLLNRLEELFTELRCLVHIDLVVEDKRRCGEIAIAHALGDDTTHRVHWYDLYTTLCSRSRRSWCSSRCSGLWCRSRSGCSNLLRRSERIDDLL